MEFVQSSEALDLQLALKNVVTNTTEELKAFYPGTLLEKHVCVCACVCVCVSVLKNNLCNASSPIDPYLNPL